MKRRDRELCGCRYYTDSKGIERVELCQEHEAQANERHEASRATGWEADRMGGTSP